jgi:hypothetical protein
MQCSRIEEYDNRVIVEEECTHKYFLSCGDLLNAGVDGAANL